MLGLTIPAASSSYINKFNIDANEKNSLIIDRNVCVYKMGFD